LIWIEGLFEIRRKEGEKGFLREIHFRSEKYVYRKIKVWFNMKIKID